MQLRQSVWFAAIVGLPIAMSISTSSFAATITTSVDGIYAVEGEINAGDTTTISLSLELDEGEDLSVVEATFELVGLDSIDLGSLAWSSDPGTDWDFDSAVIDTSFLGLSLTRDNSDANAFMAELSFTWTDDGDFYLVVVDTLTAKDIVAPPFFEEQGPLYSELTSEAPTFGGQPLVVLGELDTLDLREFFLGLPRALYENLGSDIIEIRDSSDAVVATARGALLSSAEVPVAGSLELVVASGSQASGDLIAALDIPGMTGPAAERRFALELLAGADAIGSSVEVTLHQHAGESPVSIRALLEDTAGNWVASDAEALPEPPVDHVDQTYRFDVHEDFVWLEEESTSFDFTAVAGVTVEFLAAEDDAAAPELAIQVHKIQLVPEPEASLQSMAAFAVLSVLFALKLRRRVGSQLASKQASLE